jgi:hypothetical protein
MTFDLVPYRAYGYVLAALSEIGPCSSTELARFLADRLTPYGDDTGGVVSGALGTGWYPMSVARLLTQIKKHHYPIDRDEDGFWRILPRQTRDQRAAIAESYRLCVLDARGPMTSTWK